MSSPAERELHDRHLTVNDHMAAGRYAEALELCVRLYEELATDSMVAASVVVHIVCCLRGLHRPDEALRWIDRGLARFPDYTDLWYLRGLTHLDARDYQKALKAFVACLAWGDAPPVYDTQQGIGTWAAWQGIGIGFCGLGRDDAAGAALGRALRANQADGMSATHLGQLLIRAGYPWEAVKRELLAIADGNSPAIRDALDRLEQSAQAAGKKEPGAETNGTGEQR